RPTERLSGVGGRSIRAASADTHGTGLVFPACDSRVTARETPHVDREIDTNREKLTYCGECQDGGAGGPGGSWWRRSVRPSSAPPAARASTGTASPAPTPPSRPCSRPAPPPPPPDPSRRE